MKKDRLVRLGIGDIVVTEEQNEKLQGYAIVYDTNGNVVTEAEIYFIEYENDDEDEDDELY